MVARHGRDDVQPLLRPVLELDRYCALPRSDDLRLLLAPAKTGGTRGVVVFALVQRLADHAADAEQGRHRPVPRLADTVLPDQLRAMADDLIAASPSDDVLTLATKIVSETRTLL